MMKLEAFSNLQTHKQPTILTFQRLYNSGHTNFYYYHLHISVTFIFGNLMTFTTFLQSLVLFYDFFILPFFVNCKNDILIVKYIILIYYPYCYISLYL